MTASPLGRRGPLSKDLPAYWRALLDEYLTDRRAAGAKTSTMRSAEKRVAHLFWWLDGQGFSDVAAVGEKELTAYLVEVRARCLEYSFIQSAEKYAATYAWASRAFFKWAQKTEKVLMNPMAAMTLPKQEQRLPTNILTVEEIRILLDAPDTRDAVGIRDRAIIELAYSAALRLGDVIKLELRDVNIEARRVFIRDGKWGKDRVLPFGDHAAQWLRRYLDESRPLLERDADEMRFFLTERGEYLKATTVQDLLEKYSKAAGFTKKVNPHMLRHTCATHMVQGGADIRYVQLLLGHESLQTTQIYAHVVVADLAEAVKKHHPRGTIQTATT